MHVTVSVLVTVVYRVVALTDTVAAVGVTRIVVVGAIPMRTV